MAEINEVFDLIDMLKKYRFYKGSFRTRMDGMIQKEFLAEGRVGYVFDSRPNPQTHPGLILGHGSMVDYEAPEKVWSLRITKEMAEQLKPEKIVITEPGDYGDIYHPYVPAMDNAKLTFCCVNCRAPLYKSLDEVEQRHMGAWEPVLRSEEDIRGILACKYCGWEYNREEVEEEVAKD